MTVNESTSVKHYEMRLIKHTVNGQFIIRTICTNSHSYQFTVCITCFSQVYRLLNLPIHAHFGVKSIYLLSPQTAFKSHKLPSGDLLISICDD